MRLLLNRRLHVNMGNYEHVELVATVEVNTETDTRILEAHGVNSGSLESIEEFIAEETQKMLQADVEDAHYGTTEDDSFIHEYHKQRSTKKK